MNKNQNLLHKGIKKNFYHDQTVSKNPLRKWFHLTRYKIANSLVKKMSSEEAKIVDLGCGSCDWNIDHLKLLGVDINKDLLQLAQEKNRLSDYKIADATNTGLPTGSFEIVTAFEFLEHVSDYDKVIKEAHRLLKEGGVCVISVPFDVFFSLWRPLFFMQVLLQGYIFGDVYYRKRCGHINHFSVKKIKTVFLKHGFEEEQIFVMKGFTIFGVFKKVSSK